MKRMKSACIITAAVLLTSAAGLYGIQAAADSVPAPVAAAEEGTEIERGDLRFQVYSDHAVITQCLNRGGAAIPAEIDGVPVTEIGARAFSWMPAMKSVVIPSNIQIIGSGAFGINPGLESVTIENGVKVIDGQAFENCLALKTIQLPDTLEEIGGWAFADCPQLEMGDVQLPAGLRYIGACAFSGLNIASMTVPEGVTEIQRGTFAGCTALKSVTLPSTITLIDEYAFTGCTMLEDITIPAAVKKIGYRAFTKCAALKTVTIPAGTETVDDYAFYECPNLTLKVAAGSAGERHAKVYHRNYEIIDAEQTGSHMTGDLSGDCKVGADDAQLALKAYTNTVAGKASGLRALQAEAADVTGDGKISVDDAQFILKYYTEKEVAGKSVRWTELIVTEPVPVTTTAVQSGTTAKMTTTTTTVQAAVTTQPARTTAPAVTLPHGVTTYVMPATTGVPATTGAPAVKTSSTTSAKP